MIYPKLFECVRHLYAQPLIVDRAKDCLIYDESRNEYLDGYAGVASVSVGHAHPLVNSRVIEQIQRLHHISMLYQSRILLEYMEDVQKDLPDPLNRHFFVNSGSEALDFACQAVRAHRKKPLIIALSDGFHGGTFQAKSITGLDAWQPVFSRNSKTLFYEVTFCRNCSESKWSADSKRLHPLGLECDASCLDGMETLLKKLGGETAGLVLEPVLGVGGIFLPGINYFRRLRELCDTHGIDLICDEVQTGFGRCGKNVFAFQRVGLEPDIVCMAKGIANGFPMGLVSATEEVSGSMAEKLHFSTFGGNPFSCAAAKATLEIIHKENLLENADVVGELLMERLNQQFLAQPHCFEIRGLGLMIGIEFQSQEMAVGIVNECYKRRLLVGIGGGQRNVVRLEPPLTFTKEMAEKTADILFQASIALGNA